MATTDKTLKQNIDLSLNKNNLIDRINSNEERNIDFNYKNIINGPNHNIGEDPQGCFFYSTIKHLNKKDYKLGVLTSCNNIIFDELLNAVNIGLEMKELLLYNAQYNITREYFNESKEIIKEIKEKPFLFTFTITGTLYKRQQYLDTTLPNKQEPNNSAEEQKKAQDIKALTDSINQAKKELEDATKKGDKTQEDAAKGKVSRIQEDIDILLAEKNQRENGETMVNGFSGGSKKMYKNKSKRKNYSHNKTLRKW